MRFFRRKKSERDQDHRAHYRANPDRKLAIGAKLVSVGGDGQTVRLLDVSAGGAGIALPDGGGPALAEGDRVSLVFGSLKVAVELPVEAEVVRVDSGADGKSYGLRFVDLESLFTDLDPFYFQVFNRRRFVRALPPLDRRLHLWWLDGERRFDSTPRDLTVEGIGAVVEGDTQAFLEGVESGRAELALKRDVPEIPLRLEVVHRTPAAKGLLIGARIVWGDEKPARAQREQLAEYVKQRQDEVARWNKASQ